jgi:2-dehydropantoate 2-reductase
VILGGRILEPGVVAHTGSGVLTLGIWPNGIDDVCRRVAADLIESGLEAPLTDDVEAAKWGKVLSNVNNAYLALVGISVQESRHFEIHRHFLADVLNEAIDVIEAAGIRADTSPQKPPRQQVASLRAPGDWEHIEITTDPDERTYPSTWQDLHFERESVEVEWFNGEIVRLAQRHGMAAPLNETLWHRCEAAAAAKAGPGTETPESLRS